MGAQTQPQTLYHVAPAEARAAIEAGGLDGKLRSFDWIERPAGTYLFRSVDAAARYQDKRERELAGPHEIWQVDAGGYRLEPDPIWGRTVGGRILSVDEAEALLFRGAVPVERLQRLSPLPMMNALAPALA